jgi:hypothetical protein
LISGICFNYLTKNHASISNVFLSFLGYFDKTCVGISSVFSKKLGLFDRTPKLIILLVFKVFLIDLWMGILYTYSQLMFFDVL